MCSFASRDPVNISSTIQHNSKTNDCVCVFERETEGDEKERERERQTDRKTEKETERQKGKEEGGERGRNLLYHMSAIVVAAPLLFVRSKVVGLFDAWSVVCFIGSDCLCVKVCRLTTVVVLVIVNDLVKYLKGPTQVRSLSLCFHLNK